ncbi:ABC transporter permease [Candidatus Villigracilis saccharophilus]|uniref:ABC transporter permease n=1 Tax=Candidatus Villigracilis saccharophilus TaxID=3140684 RepID=UPI003135E8D0|nr:ABC transporter permease [Anaerolineales bacterium]
MKFDILAYLAPGMALMFLMYTVSYGGRSILAEKAQGTLPRLLSFRQVHTNFRRKSFWNFPTGRRQMLIVIGASSLFFQLKWGDPFGVIILVLAAVFGATGWGMFITALARTPAQVASVGSAIMLIFGIMGGSFISLDQMPPAIQTFSKITPNAWALDGFTTLGLGGTLADLSSPIVALLTMGTDLAFGFCRALRQKEFGAEMKNYLPSPEAMPSSDLQAHQSCCSSLSCHLSSLFCSRAGLHPITTTTVRLVVVDQANTVISQNIIAELDRSTAVRPEVLSLKEAENQFDSRRATVVLVIPADLDLQAIQDGTAQVNFRQQPNNLNATVAERAVQTALRSVSSAVNAANNAVKTAEENGVFESEADRQAYFDDALKLAQTMQADAPERVTVVEGSTPDRIEYDPRASSSAGQLITWVFIPLFGISGLFAYERQQGTLRRVLTTPTSKATYLLGTISGQVVMALVQMSLRSYLAAS